MASAKDGYRHVAALFDDELAALDPAGAGGARRRVGRAGGDARRRAAGRRVERVERLTPTIVEVVVRAPAAARHFQPGQFYRLQNFEALAARAKVPGEPPLLMEGLALTGAWVDKEKGLLSLIVLEMGVSSRLSAYLKPGEPVVVMGPTGHADRDPARRERCCWPAAASATRCCSRSPRRCKENGNRVIYFAGYKKGEDLYKREEIEAATDQVIWSTDIGRRDRAGAGRRTRTSAATSCRRWWPTPTASSATPLVPLPDVSRIIAIGSDRMMAAVKAARHGVLAPYLRPDHVAIASINSPMQCMMKEVCAQCLQKHVDPVTGKEEFVFSCFNQDQELDRVDFPNLNARLRQNTVQEKLSNLWLDHLLDTVELPRV